MQYVGFDIELFLLACGLIEVAAQHDAADGAVLHLSQGPDDFV